MCSVMYTIYTYPEWANLVFWELDNNDMKSNFTQ